MPVSACAASLLRLLACLFVLAGFTQCAALNRFDSPSNSGEATEEPGDEAEDGEEEDEGEDDGEEEDEEGEERDLRLVAVDQTPFFRWLRSGLRSNAKPTRFLDKGTEVELLEEKDEEKFSRVRLPNGKKGWVPSRLVSETVAGNGESTTNPELAPGESDPVDPDEGDPAENRGGLPDLKPDQLPSAGNQGLPPADDLGPPIIPELEITTPDAPPIQVEREPESSESELELEVEVEGSDPAPSEGAAPEAGEEVESERQPGEGNAAPPTPDA